jgi:hypothetical protein
MMMAEAELKPQLVQVVLERAKTIPMDDVLIVGTSERRPILLHTWGANLSPWRVAWALVRLALACLIARAR